MNGKITLEQRKKELDLIFLIIDKHQYVSDNKALARIASNDRTEDLNRLSGEELAHLKVYVTNYFLKLEMTTDIEALAMEMNLGKEEGLNTLEAIDKILHLSEISQKHYWELDKKELYRLKGLIEVLHGAYIEELNVDPAKATASLLKELGIKVQSSSLKKHTK